MRLRFPATFTAAKLYPLRYALLPLLLLLVFWLALGSNHFGAVEIATQSTTALQQAVAPVLSTSTSAPPTLVSIAAATATPITLADNRARRATPTMTNAVTPTLVTLTPTAPNAATTPTVRPTATRVALTPDAPDRLPPVPSPAVTDPQAAVGNACADCTVTLDEPLDPLLYGRRTFRWTPTFNPDGQYLFELVFWEEGQSAMQHGRSPVGAKAETSITVDLDRAAATLGLRTELTYTWGVLLVDASDVRKRIRQLSPDQPFQWQLAGDGAGAD